MATQNANLITLVNSYYWAYVVEMGDIFQVDDVDHKIINTTQAVTYMGDKLLWGRVPLNTDNFLTSYSLEGVVHYVEKA